jgi:hypothetical protein
MSTGDQSGKVPIDRRSILLGGTGLAATVVATEPSKLRRRNPHPRHPAKNQMSSSS